MAQKNETISTGLNALFGSSAQNQAGNEPVMPEVAVRHHGRPRKGDKPQTFIGEEMRTSLIVNRGVYDKIRIISIREGLTVKEVVHYAFQHAVENYEKKNGPIDLTYSPP